MGANKSMREDVEQIIMQAGVASGCPAHPSARIYQYDDESERRACAMATHRWKDSHYTPMVTLDEFMSAVRQAIADVPADCPQCARLDDA